MTSAHFSIYPNFTEEKSRTTLEVKWVVGDGPEASIRTHSAFISQDETPESIARILINLGEAVLRER